MLPIILASRSPQRRQLLELLAPGRVAVRPPENSAEAGFAGLQDFESIQRRLLEISRTKLADVRRQLESETLSSDSWAAIVAADTTMIVGEAPSLVVLGQPPEKGWRNTTRQWFRDYLSGRTHQVLTAVVVATHEGSESFIACSTVRFHPVADDELEWYLTTEESPGRAGGYAIQGAGNLFVQSVTGSLSNVIGLPLRETRSLLKSIGAL